MLPKSSLCIACRCHYCAWRGKNSLIYAQFSTLAWAACGHLARFLDNSMVINMCFETERRDEALGFNCCNQCNKSVRLRSNIPVQFQLFIGRVSVCKR